MTREQLYREVVAERFGTTPTEAATTTVAASPRPTAALQVIRLARYRWSPAEIDTLLRLPAGRAARILAARERRAR